MAGRLVPATVIGANPVPKSKLPKVRKQRKTRKAKRRKAARNPASAHDLTPFYEDSLRNPAKPGYSAKPGTRSAKDSTRKDDEMAARKSKKRSTKGKSKSTKRRSSKRRKKSGESTAKRRAAAKKGARRAKRRGTAETTAERSRAARKPRRKSRKSRKTTKRASSKRRMPRKGKVRRKSPRRSSATIQVRGIEHLTVKNPSASHIGGFVATAAAGAGAGYVLVSLIDRWYATASFHKDANGNPLFGTDTATGKPAAASGEAAKAAIMAFSWTRVGISAGISAAAIGVGMYGFKSGYARTGFLWLGLGGAAYAGATLLSKWLLPMLFSKNSTYANRLAPDDVAIYQAAHPSTSGVSGVHGALGNAGCGCGGSEDCGCATCSAKRMQNLERQLRNNAAAPINPALVQQQPAQPAPLPANPAPSAQVFNRPLGSAPVVPFARVERRRTARA